MKTSKLKEKFSDLKAETSAIYWVVTLENEAGDLEFVTKDTVEPRAGIEVFSSKDPLAALKIPSEGDDAVEKFINLIAPYCAKLGWKSIFAQKIRLSIEIIDTKKLIDVKNF